MSDAIARGIPLEEEPGLGALTLPGYLREVCEAFGPREALAWAGPHGMVRWSYAELWERANAVARALLACGVGRDGRVGVLMTNRPEQLAAAFGAALAGATPVMLDTFATPDELQHLLGASSVAVLLFERRVAGRDFAEGLAGLEPALGAAAPGRLQSERLPHLRRLAVLEDETATASAGGGAVEHWQDFLAHGRATPPALVEAASRAVSPADAGAIFFSSGTTSRPKGVLHGQRAIALQWWRWGRLMGMQAPVRSWTPNGFFWSGNFSMVVGGTFSVGGALVLQSIFEPEAALALIGSERVSFALAWPHQWARLEGSPSWRGADLSNLRYVKDDTPAARHPTVDTGWLSPPSYGCTETLTISTGFAHDTPPDVVAGSHGEPLPGNSLKIVDPASGAALARGERGEIAVKGPTLMLGYLSVPLRDALDSEGFFRSGDQGRLDAAGRLFWEGRLSDVIKSGGANVSPREIDAVLAEHPAVKVSQTVGVPHETLGEMVVACIVLHAGAALDEAELRAFAAERLAAYKRPKRVLFLREAELATTTGSDKLKTQHLRELGRRRLAEADGSA